MGLSNEEILGAIETRIDQNPVFRANLESAIVNRNEARIAELVFEVLGFIVRHAEEIWSFLRRLFGR